MAKPISNFTVSQEFIKYNFPDLRTEFLDESDYTKALGELSEHVSLSFSRYMGTLAHRLIDAKKPGEEVILDTSDEFSRTILKGLEERVYLDSEVPENQNFYKGLAREVYQWAIKNPIYLQGCRYEINHSNQLVMKSPPEGYDRSKHLPETPWRPQA